MPGAFFYAGPSSVTDYFVQMQPWLVAGFELVGQCCSFSPAFIGVPAHPAQGLSHQPPATSHQPPATNYLVQMQP